MNETAIHIKAKLNLLCAETLAQISRCCWRSDMNQPFHIPLLTQGNTTRAFSVVLNEDVDNICPVRSVSTLSGSDRLDHAKKKLTMKNLAYIRSQWSLFRSESRTYMKKPQVGVSVCNVQVCIKNWAAGIESWNVFQDSSQCRGLRLQSVVPSLFCWRSGKNAQRLLDWITECDTNSSINQQRLRFKSVCVGIKKDICKTTSHMKHQRVREVPV